MAARCGVGQPWGQDTATGCQKAETPDKVEGQVVKVDLDQGTLTLRATDGKTYVFSASKETLSGVPSNEDLYCYLTP